MPSHFKGSRRSVSALLRFTVECVTQRQNLHAMVGSILTRGAAARIREAMKIFSLFLCAILLAGCAGKHPKGVVQYDDFEAVEIEQMIGNNVSQAVLSKTIVCLNARRETRRVTMLTNTLVTAATNQVIASITNTTISLSTNLVYTVMTNLTPAAPLPPPAVAADGTAVTSTAETNTTVAFAPAEAALSTNFTFSVANNASGSRAPNQLIANNQSVRTLNLQLTTASNNLSIALMTNIVITGETNLMVSYVTNVTITAITNTILKPTNGVAYDYFLFTEMIPPADFNPVTQGESLVLLVDNVRYGFVPTPSSTAFAPRKGYTTALYRVHPEVLVAIANAKEVRLRCKGSTSTLERTMSASSRRHFRDFLTRYFVPEDPNNPPGNSMAAVDSSSATLNR